jgi:prolyl-tRNA editing enzyme YbaK/EbsC (Cys-tRNA(Pro) deacylase)
MSLLDRDSVLRFRSALQAAGSAAAVIELEETARSAEDAAQAIGCQLGQIVKSLVFVIDGAPALALVAGDRRCRPPQLASALVRDGKVGRADADLVKAVTGFSIGGVPPFGHVTPLPAAIDSSLWRYPVVYAAAGHPHCVFPAGPDELATMAGAVRSDDLSEPIVAA